MRKAIIVATSLLFVVGSAFGQQPNRSNTVSVFASDLSIGRNYFDTSYGAAFGHMFNKNWSAELSVTRQPIRQYFTTFVAGGVPTTTNSSDQIYPIDASISYHFLTNGRWKPYVGGGLRYLNRSVPGDGPLGKYRIYFRSTDPEITGGVTFQFRPNLGLRLDAKKMVGSSRSVLGDSSLSGSLGLSFGF
ncbi:MAG TPA: outer membrane beta-barrel protein [Thermoanaerobaculia bacterium]|nr:outer membrane beta-barrel protein [Thermoanaerobaculia bacterium]